MQNYIPRLIDTVLEKKLRAHGAVLLEGCKWCGKSTTAARQARSILELQNPETGSDNIELAKTKPSIILEGEKPRLIDEWQDAPTLWDAIRYDIDKTRKKGQYILTGSATPATQAPRHSGTGRIVRLTMRPMSLYESGESTGEVSLGELFAGASDVKGASEYDVEDYAYLCARGGWPDSIVNPPEDAIEIASEYINSIVNNEFGQADGVLHNPRKMRLVIRSIARNVSTPVNITTIYGDTKDDSDIESVSDKTVKSYLDILERLHVRDDVEAWSPQLRSKTEIRVSDKLNLVDPSLAVAALFATEHDLIRDFRTFGLIFESLCTRDLKVYAQHLDGEVMYYRDGAGLECDNIVHLRDGRWAAIEVKVGSQERIEEGAKNLNDLEARIDTDKVGKPAFKMILTAQKFAYRREDGIFVVPIGCLKP
ncbi:ATP-binding protein [Candidatus Saccharibacteria bacterium]|nr:ATP-binding protein [Candidatus Saccharibacteria bacterium]